MSAQYKNPPYLITKFESTNPKTFDDLLLVLAKNVEDSLLSAGAIPGKDYTILDCYKMAQPFALEIFKSNNDISYTISWP